MSVGNLKDNGNKGNNFPYQLGALQLLKMINDSITGGGGGAGLFTEATGLQVLAALQNGQEFEQILVVDLGGVGCPANCPVYVQIRIWDTVTHTFGAPTYYNAAGAVVVPVGPLQFVNPQVVLDNILTQVTAINTTLTTSTSRVPTVVNIPSGSIGNTTAGVQELGILVIGGGNTVGGVAVPNGTVITYTARDKDTVGSIAYTTGGGANRLILTYLT